MFTIAFNIFQVKNITNIYIHTQTHIRASLMAQMVKLFSEMQETWVRSLGWEDPLEKEMAAH